MPNISARDKARVAGGAGFVFLGRMGALIEAASFIAFSWFYGTATFGLFAVLWSYVKLTTALTQIAMNTALQRFIPKAKKEDESLIAGFALKISFMISATVAGL
ncbi:MAG: hypothetical protein JKY34_05165, partial [Kordiimonadaceae bacterium]|nr:hypothetical protein [Kordiimonadaceae bacterium]